MNDSLKYIINVIYSFFTLHGTSLWIFLLLKKTSKVQGTKVALMITDPPLTRGKHVVTCDILHVTRDMWHMTCDKWGDH